MSSHTLRLYRSWLATATKEQIALADAIYAECEKRYEAGGDIIVETFTPAELLMEFGSVAEAMAYCGLKVEQACNARWGEDTDPELKRLEKFEKWEGGKQ